MLVVKEANKVGVTFKDETHSSSTVLEAETDIR